MNIAVVAMVNYTAIPHTNVTTAEECGREDQNSSFIDPNAVTMPRHSSELILLTASLIDSFWFTLIHQGRRVCVGRADAIVDHDVLLLGLHRNAAAVGYSGAEIRHQVSLRRRHIDSSRRHRLFTVTRQSWSCLLDHRKSHHRSSSGWANTPNSIQFIIHYPIQMVLLVQGACFPSMHNLLAKWAPPLQRSSMSAFIYAGSQVGTIIGLPLSGFLIETLGWEAMFYIEGPLAVIFLLMWMTLVYDSPDQHPRISAKEKDYIARAMGSDKQHVNILFIPSTSFSRCFKFFEVFYSVFYLERADTLEVDSYIGAILGSAFI